MKNLLSVFVLLLSFFAYSGNNDIYLTQTGTGLTLTIDQIGATNTIGTSQARVAVSGASMTIDLDQIGDSNTLAASILQAASSSWTYSQTGSNGSATFAVGATGDVAQSDFDWASSGGDGNILVFTQGADATATGGNNDFAITGASNNLNVKCEVVGCINNWTVSGNSNDIDTSQAGDADSSITATVTGGSNNIDVVQSGDQHTVALTHTGSSMVIDIAQTDTASSNVANLLLQASGGSGSTINIDQCASGC